jgi:hypothetical protein
MQCSPSRLTCTICFNTTHNLTMPQVIQIIRATAQQHTLSNPGSASSANVQMSADGNCLRGAVGE